MSADLSWADVTEGAELKQEVVVGEGRLRVGYAAVVTCRGQRGNKIRLLTGVTASWKGSDRAALT